MKFGIEATKCVTISTYISRTVLRRANTAFWKLIEYTNFTLYSSTNNDMTNKTKLVIRNKVK